MAASPTALRSSDPPGGRNAKAPANCSDRSWKEYAFYQDGLMEPRNAYESVNRHLADLAPLLDAPAHFRQTIVGGDLNLTTQWTGEAASYAPIDRALLDQFRAWGLRDLVAESTDDRLEGVSLRGWRTMPSSPDTVASQRGDPEAERLHVCLEATAWPDIARRRREGCTAETKRSCAVGDHDPAVDHGRLHELAKQQMHTPSVPQVRRCGESKATRRTPIRRSGRSIEFRREPRPTTDGYFSGAIGPGADHSLELPVVVRKSAARPDRARLRACARLRRSMLTS